MAVHKYKDFSWANRESRKAVVDGDTLYRCMLVEVMPGTQIFDGKKNLTFEDCHLRNAVPPSDANVIGCNVSDKRFCSHLHPEMIPYGLVEEAEDCEHSKQTTIEAYVVDGETIVPESTVYEHDEDQVDDGDSLKFVEYRHIDKATSKIVSGKTVLS